MTGKWPYASQNNPERKEKLYTGAAETGGALLTSGGEQNSAGWVPAAASVHWKERDEKAQCRTSVWHGLAISVSRCLCITQVLRSSGHPSMPSRI
ncbi:hypothetical protein MHYP_G00060390 [Metynnis hypsauchen]